MTTAAHIIGALLRFLFAVIGALAQFAIHHRLTALAALVAIAAAVLFYRRVLSRSAQVRRRARALRWRIRLRLRPGAGYASLAELVFRWGRLPAAVPRRPCPAGPAVPGPGVLAGDGLRGAPRPGAVRPPVSGPAGGPAADDRPAADRQVRDRWPTGCSTIPARPSSRRPGRTCTTSPRVPGRSAGPVYVFNPQHVGGLPSASPGTSWIPAPTWSWPAGWRRG